MAAGDQTLSDALLLITKVSNNQNKRLDKLEKVSGSSYNEGPKKVEELVKKPEPRIITDFGKSAEKDLRNALTQKEEDGEKKPEGGFNFIKKLIGPALLVLGGLSALVTGLMTDGPLKGLFNILSKGGIIGGVKLFANLAGKQMGKFTETFAKILPKNLFGNIIESAKSFLGGIGKFLLAPFKKLGGKGAAKGVFGVISKLFAKTLQPVLKRIPGIGSLISWGFAVSRFKSGQLGRGLIDLASGIATLFPGLGTGLSIGLDVLNAFLDVKAGNPEEVKPAGSGFKIGDFFGNVKDKIMNNFPIKNLFEFFGGVGDVMGGNFKGGFTRMAFAIPFMKPLSDFLFNEKEEATDKGGNFSFGTFFKNIKDKILVKVLSFLPEKILGFSVRSRAAKMLGIDMGPIVDGESAQTNFTDIQTENNKPRRRELGGEVKAKNEYIVGEAGPELFVPESEGFIVSNDKSLNLLDKETFSSLTTNIGSLQDEQLKELKKQNIFLKALIEKSNSTGNVVSTTNTNTSIINSSKGPSIKQFREMYA
tara:strand:+ start:550 stop:2151 length:1602 start_codon:yes stop_codon:yes gene_type:complete